MAGSKMKLSDSHANRNVPSVLTDTRIEAKEL
jgi:hypothetical protein